MIDKKSRRVVIINNIQSDTIDQAIFILKSDKSDVRAKGCDANIAKEAQTIINNYIRQVERLKATQPHSSFKKNTAGRKIPGWFKGLLFTAVAAAFAFFFTHSL